MPIAAAEQRVVEHRALDGIDAGEGVGADRGVAGLRSPVPGVRAGLQVDGDAGGRVVVVDAGVAVADDGVVAAGAGEFVEGAERTDVGAGCRQKPVAS